jgi:hypothetical protein
VPAPAVAATAMMQCSFGVAPSALVTMNMTVLVEGKPAATITDAAPLVNIPPFGMCSSLANPTVAAATAAALGVLTPMPCVPNTAAWIPPVPLVQIMGKPAFNLQAKCICAWGGVIQIINPGTQKTVL